VAATVTEPATTATTTNEIKGGSAVTDTRLALQQHGSGSALAAAAAAAWQQCGISSGSCMAGKAMAGRSGSLAVAARHWRQWQQRHCWQQQWWGAAIINNQQST
jgi:hypothetical protein